MDSDAVQKRLEEVEVRLAHQEYIQDEQARVQLELQQSNHELRRQVEWLRERLRELEGRNAPDPSGHEPPPHY